MADPDVGPRAAEATPEPAGPVEPVEPAAHPPLSRALVLLFAAAAGVAVATVYLAQPLLVTMGRDFGLSPGTVGLVVTLTQAGYGLGLFLLVPLGDLVDRRRLIVTQFAVLAAALAAVGVAGDTALLLAAMAAVGLLAVVTQSVVAYAASLAGPAERGRVVGLVTSGVVTGILLARTVSGALADLAGWRSAYLVSAALTSTLAAALYRVLPRTDVAASALSYRELLGSMVTLFAGERVFRIRAALALLIFAAFGTLWSSVALPLSEAPWSLSHTAIGAFGLAGVAGALAATPAGRLNDRGHARWTTGVGLVLLTLSWIPLAFTRHTLWALVVGAVVLDLAVQAVHVTNQTLIYNLRPEAGSRLIGGYMIFYSIGSATGAITSTTMYAATGWIGVCALGAGFSGSALALWALTLDRPSKRRPAAPVVTRSAAR
ncbi:MFS transporter [Streptomyces sp. SID3343]|uniref:MFS transporter n=1 Tax=Streptomyces sp. SID3343 TaxID=2690260 RepID=UPI00136D084E|nr:MFS transporter [Streptomyces sp. SID3343]MYW02579.1 MFS transporter [Streptomyces sp. SID3343]